MLLPVLLVLFVAVPIVELVVILQVGDWLGLWPTVALLIASSIIGSVLMRSQGRAAWRNFNAAVGQGRPPAREVLDGVLIIFGGALLLTPGFVTDLVGMSFLFPPTRAVIRKVLVQRLAHRMVVAGSDAFLRGRTRPGRPGPAYDFEGTATEVDRDPRRLP